jgi:uncharacterized protein (TIGR03032 family)
VTAPSAKPPLEVSCSPGLVPWLESEDLSLVFTTYQTCRLFFVGRKDEGRPALFERLFDRAMGLAADPERLYLATRSQIWRFDNVLAEGETYRGADRLYVPRIGTTTGGLDVHDMAVDGAGRLIFVNTRYGCLATLSERYSFKPLWRPPFLSELVPEDRCHLNGLAMADGEPRYVTAVSRSDVFNGWRERRADGGVVIDVESGEIVASGLSMPHSPRLYQGELWVHDSGRGEFGKIDLAKGVFEPVTFCPGYLRGLAFHRHHAVVGLSKPRDRHFQGLALDQRLAEKDSAARCGLMVIDLRNGRLAHWIELEGVVKELYDVGVLPGVKRPQALGFKTDEIHRVVAVEGEDGGRGDLSWLDAEPS